MYAVNKIWILEFPGFRHLTNAVINLGSQRENSEVVPLRAYNRNTAWSMWSLEFRGLVSLRKHSCTSGSCRRIHRLRTWQLFLLSALFSCVSNHRFKTKDCTWLSWFACLLICFSGKLSICCSRFFFSPTICERYLLILAVSLCLLKPWLLYNFFLHCRAFKMCSLCPGQIPKLSILCFSHLQGPINGSWEWKVCVGKQIYLSVLYPFNQDWILSESC